MKNLLLLLAGTGILLAGCSKDDNVFGNKPIGNRYDVVSAHPWKLVKLQENDNEVSLKSCQLDDVYVFDFEGFGYMDEGATKCGEVAPVDTTTNPTDTTIIVSKATISEADNLEYDPSGRRINFTWTVPGDQRYVLIYNYGSSENNPEWEILEMDSSHFVVKGTEKRNGVLIVYYKHFQAL